MLSRFCTLTALLAAAVAAPVLAADSDSPLLKDRGQYRPLIVIARSSADPAITGVKKALEDPATNKAFKDRNMVLYTVAGTIGQRDGKYLDPQPTMAMIRELKLGASDAAWVVLVGKDGEKKLEDKGTVDLKKIFAAIDQMPMAEKQATPAPEEAPAKAAPAGKGAKAGKAAPAEPPSGLDD
ncbi:DUF4174 domain-containing protein [Pseudomonas sp. dw_358]|uniref:DUF4174 domain-containing protein n=1 Tax=Pseudomonas sp. dw_358 TaxID=2720083 RepID=UPI001BD63D08|nr:DUF4174 domain-containing protein [Pseudomonas sp. dw_358]